MSKSPHQVLPFPRERLGTVDLLKVASSRPIIHGLIEVDMTEALNRIHTYEQQTGDDLSVVAFIAHCLGKAIAEYPTIHAYRVGMKLYVFDDVDVNIMVERDTKHGSLPTQHVLRRAQHRSVIELSDDIRQAQSAPIEKGNWLRMLRLFTSLPAFVRHAMFRIMTRFPQMWKDMGGTTAITSVGMFGEGAGWGLPISPVSLMLTLGGMGKKPAVVDGCIEIRDMLCVTISFDHAITDGAPAARFTTRLKQLIEAGEGLPDLPMPASEYAHPDKVSNS